MIESPVPSENPVTSAEDPVPVHEKVAPGISEVRGILVESPEQIALERGVVVTMGGVVTKSWIVSKPLQP